MPSKETKSPWMKGWCQSYPREESPTRQHFYEKRKLISQAYLPLLLCDLDSLIYSFQHPVGSQVPAVCENQAPTVPFFCAGLGHCEPHKMLG